MARDISKEAMKQRIARRLFPLLLLAVSALPVQAIELVDLPAVFKKTVPERLKEGLKLVELKQRCDDCAPWRSIEYRDNKQPQPIKLERVSVQAGVTAMYAFPGTEYFANTKIEQSAPGMYAKDKAVVIDAIKHEFARKKERVADYLAANSDTKEKVDRLVPKGKDYIEFEQASYKGIEFVSYTENVIGLNGATISQLHMFIPTNDMIITAYLLKQKKAKFSNIAEFLKMRRDFIEDYIDFLTASAAGL